MEGLGDFLNVAGIFGLIYSILQWLYYNKMFMFVWINKFMSFKKDVNFELLVLSEDKDIDIDIVYKIFRAQTKTEFQIISKSETKINFSFDTLIVSLEKDDFNEDGYHFSIHIRNKNSTYSKARKDMHLIGKLISTIQKEGMLNKPKFQFKSIFPKNNPFLGNSISRIGVDNIKRFIMVLSLSDFKSSISSDNDIQVNLNEVSYADYDFEEIKAVSELIFAL